jgi:hypothetical protein
LEELSAELRPDADRLLRKLLDEEGLFTLVSGLKPATLGFWHGKVDIAKPDLVAVERTRRILRAFRCGDSFVADVTIINKPYQDGKRYAHAWIAHRPTMTRKIAEHLAFFSRFDLTPSSEPAAVFTAIAGMDGPDRDRAWGLLFGYPREAVDFFVEAGAEQKRTGKFVTRDFLSIPTHAGSNRFVWAVPKGYRETDADRLMRDRAAPWLAQYRQRRELYFSEGGLGPAELLRDWFDDGSGRCDPAHARPDLFTLPGGTRLSLPSADGCSPSGESIAAPRPIGRRRRYGSPVNF